jgi:CRISPR-associated protein Csx3
LHSQLKGEEQLLATRPTIQGTLTGLHRSTRANGPLFQVLVEELATLFHYNGMEAQRLHQIYAPAELVIDLHELARTLGLDRVNSQGDLFWQPRHLLPVLNQLPEDQPIAGYQRGTAWLHAAIARFLHPTPYYHFDARYGWVQPRLLNLVEDPKNADLQIETQELADAVHLKVTITTPSRHLDIETLPAINIPALPATHGIILSGQIPYWLYTSLTISYHQHPWLAIFQPQLAGAVVIYSHTPRHAMGEVIFILKQGQ